MKQFPPAKGNEIYFDEAWFVSFCFFLVWQPQNRMAPRLDSYAQFAAPSSDEALYCVLGAVVQFNFNKPVVTYTHLLTAQAVGGGRNY